jgi:predicted metal-dependent hydrolase
VQLLRHTRANREMRLGDHLVAYELRHARRGTIGFIVNQDGLAVSAPRWLGQREIDAALQIKARWILRKLADQGERLQRQVATRPVWRDGMLLPYQGGLLRLELVPALPSATALVPAHPLGAQDDAGADGTPLPPSWTPALTAHPSPARHVLQLRLALDAEPAQIRATTQSWLQEQARRLFAARCQHYASRMNVQPRRIALSAARTRWGSASSDGSVRLNWRLIHYPLATLDYVVVHELAHLHEMNHSPAFWAIVRAVLPDYETHRRVLKDGAVLVLD